MLLFCSHFDSLVFLCLNRVSKMNKRQIYNQKYQEMLLNIGMAFEAWRKLEDSILTFFCLSISKDSRVVMNVISRFSNFESLIPLIDNSIGLRLHEKGEAMFWPSFIEKLKELIAIRKQIAIFDIFISSELESDCHTPNWEICQPLLKMANGSYSISDLKKYILEVSSARQSVNEFAKSLEIYIKPPEYIHRIAMV